MHYFRAWKLECYSRNACLINSGHVRMWSCQRAMLERALWIKSSFAGQSFCSLWPPRSSTFYLCSKCCEKQEKFQYCIPASGCAILFKKHHEKTIHLSLYHFGSRKHISTPSEFIYLFNIFCILYPCFKHILHPHKLMTIIHLRVDKSLFNKYVYAFRCIHHSLVASAGGTVIT